MSHRVGFLVFPDFQILDLSGPLAAFETARAIAGPDTYALQVVSETGGLVSSSAGLAVSTERIGDAPFDTLVIAGGSGSRAPPTMSTSFMDLVRSMAGRARRVTSVCTGAFILARTGLLDGRTVTTHWRQAAELARRHPTVRVESDRIFVKDGDVWSSAGIAAGIDLALALIEEDCGTDVSRAVAKQLVVYHRRPGGQSQFSTLLDLDPETDRIRRALTYARDNLREPLSVEVLARAACLSPRQFARAFRAETGETPAKAVERLRAEAARLKLETGSDAVEAVAISVGFADPERMRRAFLRLFGHPPRSLQRLARLHRTSADSGFSSVVHPD